MTTLPSHLDINPLQEKGCLETNF